MEETKKGFVTSTNNCSVSVFIKRSDYPTSYVTVKYIQELETIAQQAVNKSFGGNKMKCARDDGIEYDSPTANCNKSPNAKKKPTSFEVNLAVKTHNELNHFCYSIVLLLYLIKKIQML